MSEIPFFKLPSAPEGLALEMNMLAHTVASGQKSAFLWQSQTPWLVLPDRFTRAPSFPEAAALSAARGWPVAPRKTGGGITPQGPGVLNLAMTFTADTGQSRAIRDSYAVIVDPLTRALSRLGIEAEATAVEGSFCDGDYNLAVGGRKIVGTAQRWRGTTCLIHALLMTDLDLGPAVEAVAQFSQELGHDTEFHFDVHCRLADLMGTATNVTGTAADALWDAVQQDDFSAYALN